MENSLSVTEAERFSQLVLACIQREYPNKPDHVLSGPSDLRSPKALHPTFYGCYDWHSSVHGHWLLVYLLKYFPQMTLANNIKNVLNIHLTAENIQKEVEYFENKNRKSFERPYGWSWLLKLYEELYTWQSTMAEKWTKALKPLADLIANQYLVYFPKQTYPIRTGVHTNTAFGLTFAIDYARTVGNTELEKLIMERANYYYLKDSNYPAQIEPSGNDFFSPSLIEADLMRRVLPKKAFIDWFHDFLPELAQNKPESLLQPAIVSDRSDPQLVHLDGLNLSRAWCMYNIAKVLNDDDQIKAILTNAANAHAKDALSNVKSGFYEGEHWLSTFAIYMLDVFNNN